jgi:hypothetical protein
MAKFLRDEYIKNVSISEDTLTQLAESFASRAKPFLDASKTDDKQMPFMTFILRFDNKGYKFFNIDEFLQHFRKAKEIERIIITIETAESISSHRNVGSYLELKLDNRNPDNSILHATSDTSDWVDSSFSTIKEILEKSSTYYGIARSVWATLAIQIFGVITGFGLSLWAASKVSGKLSIENSFIISFLFILLLFSNAWGYLNQALLLFIHNVFPNIQFFRPNKDRKNWLLQGVIVGLAGALALYILGGVFSYVGEFLNELVK